MTTGEARVMQKRELSTREPLELSDNSLGLSCAAVRAIEQYRSYLSQNICNLSHPIANSLFQTALEHPNGVMPTAIAVCALANLSTRYHNSTNAYFAVPLLANEAQTLADKAYNRLGAANYLKLSAQLGKIALAFRTRNGESLPFASDVVKWATLTAESSDKGTEFLGSTASLRSSWFRWRGKETCSVDAKAFIGYMLYEVLDGTFSVGPAATAKPLQPLLTSSEGNLSTLL